MWRKQNLARALSIQKENWGYPCIFLEIIKLQFGKERSTLLCILKLFTNILINYLSNMRVYHQFFYFILLTLKKIVEICFSRVFINRAKNTFELVGTVLKCARYLSGCLKMH